MYKKNSSPLTLSIINQRILAAPSRHSPVIRLLLVINHILLAHKRCVLHTQRARDKRAPLRLRRHERTFLQKTPRTRACARIALQT